MPRSFPHLTQGCAVLHCVPEDARQRIHIAAGKHVASLTFSNQIEASSNSVTDNNGTFAQHGLIDHESEWLMFRRQHENV